MNTEIYVVAALLAALALIVCGHKFTDTWESAPMSGVLSPMAGILGYITLIIYCAMAWSWVSSDYEAKLINEEFNTNFTQAEVFFASSVINEVRELKRQRIEVTVNN